MELGYARLTVWFEDPFWVGVYEREDAGQLEVCKQVFGAEPRDYQVFEWLLREWRALPFSPGVAAGRRKVEHAGAKRRQRTAAELGRTGVGTKAQQALQMQRELNKDQRRERRKQRDAAEDERKFLLRQQKKKEKHRGR